MSIKKSHDRAKTLGVDMGMRDFLAELLELSRLKNNWHSVAGVFEKVKVHSGGQAHSARRIREACDASGYSLNTLNRMIAVKAFYDSIKGNIRELDGVDPNSLSFPSLEVVKRLHQVNPEGGLKMLSEVAAGRITYRDLREYYNKTITSDHSKASVHQVSKRQGAGFKDAAIDAIRLAVDEIFNENDQYHIQKIRYRPPFSVDAIAHSSQHEELLPIGFETFYVRSHEDLKRRLELFLNDMLFKSYFFQNLWIIFPSTLGKDRLNAFCQILDLFDRHTIGVTMLPWEEDSEHASNGALEIIRRPNGTQGDRERLRKFDELHRCLVKPL